MFRTRNRYEQSTLKAQIYSKGMVVVREVGELMTGYQDQVTVHCTVLYREENIDLDIYPNELSD